MNLVTITYNHERHSTTKAIPYEVRTEYNIKTDSFLAISWSQRIWFFSQNSVNDQPEKISEEDLSRMIEEARFFQQKRAARNFAASIKNQRTPESSLSVGDHVVLRKSKSKKFSKEQALFDSFGIVKRVLGNYFFDIEIRRKAVSAQNMTNRRVHQR